MSNALNDVMAQAEEKAASTPTPNVPVAQNDNTGGPVALAKPSMDDFMDGGGMDVDEFFKLKADGFRIGDSMQGLIEEVEVELDMDEVVPVYQARFETGGNCTFLRSYDGATTTEGKDFQAEVDRLTQTNDKASGIYQSAEIPVTLLETIKDPKKGSNVEIEAETRVGYTPSVTGFKPFQRFMRQLRKQDPSLLNKVLRIKLVHEKRTNRNNNEWGILNFELLGEAE